MHQHRKSICVDELGWRLPVAGSYEIDAYDRHDTVYLLAFESHEPRLLASARLLPTSKPHLMGDLFAGSCEGGAPQGPHVWEASRFCPAPEATRRQRVELLERVFCAVMETCMLFGIEEVIFTANAALLPLALNCGWHARKLGPTLPDGKDETTAVTVAINAVGLRAIRARFGIEGPVTRFAAHIWAQAA